MDNDRYGEKLKNMKKYGYIITGAFLIFIGTWGQISGKNNDPEISKPGLQELFNSAFYLIKNRYVDANSNQELMIGAIQGMIKSLDDDHTRLLTPTMFKELQVETSGEFVGLGIEISIRNDYLTVVSPIEGTPAMRAGLMPGDKIIEINRKSTKNITLREAVSKLRGRPGTSVNITVAREGYDDVFYFSITRDTIKIKSVRSKIIQPDNIGYLRLKQFSQNSTEEVKKALLSFKAKKVKGVIFDLRMNPGGLLSAAHDISNFFIEKGVIVSTKGRIESENKVRRASPEKAIAKDLPLIILANEGSASASEIVTGAVKDHNRGIFIGTKTFGKGSVQNAFPLNYNYALLLTVQKYYTPSGVCIHKKGIKPDIEVKPLDFTDDDKSNYKELHNKKILEGYFKKPPEYNKENLKKFMNFLKDKNLPLSLNAAKIVFKNEYYKIHKRPIYDLEMDVQLKRAIKEMKRIAG